MGGGWGEGGWEGRVAPLSPSPPHTWVGVGGWEGRVAPLSPSPPHTWVGMGGGGLGREGCTSPPPPPHTWVGVGGGGLGREGCTSFPLPPSHMDGRKGGADLFAHLRDTEQSTRKTWFFSSFFSSAHAELIQFFTFIFLCFTELHVGKIYVCMCPATHTHTHTHAAAAAAAAESAHGSLSDRNVEPQSVKIGAHAHT